MLPNWWWFVIAVVAGFFVGLFSMREFNVYDYLIALCMLICFVAGLQISYFIRW